MGSGQQVAAERCSSSLLPSSTHLHTAGIIAQAVGARLRGKGCRLFPLSPQALLKGPSILVAVEVGDQAEWEFHTGQGQRRWSRHNVYAGHWLGHDSVPSVKDTVGRGPGSKHSQWLSLSQQYPFSRPPHETLTELFVNGLAHAGGSWTRLLLLLSRERAKPKPKNLHWEYFDRGL